MASQEVAAAKVASIFIYPIKSCRGISVSEAPLASTVVRATGMDLLKIPLAEPSTIADGVSIWEWAGGALDEGNEASEWFSRFLGKPSRLVRFNEASETRPVYSDPVRSYKIKFNDMYPFLLASQGSLDALNDRLEEPIPMNRFRPNILVEGCEPFSEDLWKEISINSLTFYAGELCYRCKIPSINQETAVAGSEPTETLRKFRSDKVLCPDKKPQGRVYFGKMLVCKDSLTQWKSKKIQVGDPVYIRELLPSYNDAAA
ncbi:uncharacterized protein [Coffea arabica]|uniref:Uncharacterized protein isoform X3 n=1 Tax=Coffea arabica TaxID=13443 RepID=A0ABM4VLS8_COFAR